MQADIRDWLPGDDLAFVALDAAGTVDLGGFGRRYRADGSGRAAPGPGDDRRAAAAGASGPAG